MIGSSHVTQRYSTVGYVAADFGLCVPQDPLATHILARLVGHDVQRESVPKPEKQINYLEKNILCKYQYYWQSDFAKCTDMPERATWNQQLPAQTVQDPRIHSISARISTPASFPVVCGLENTNVHVSWSWAAKEKSPPKRQSCRLLVPLKLFTMVQHNVTFTTISHTETAFFFTSDVI